MKTNRIYIILLICLVFDVYANVLGGQFAYDDYYFIRDNPGIRTLSNFGGFFTDITRTASQELRFDIYRPLTTISFALTYALFNLDPFPYHLINVILHAINTVLVFYLAGRILKPPQPPFAKGGSEQLPPFAKGGTLSSPPLVKGGEGGFCDLMSFFIAAIFAVHPVQTEAVSWISGRSNVQFLFFMLASFLVYLRSSASSPFVAAPFRVRHFVQGRRLKPAATYRRWIFYAVSILLYAMSVLSKEAGLVLPALILVFFIFMSGGHKWREFKKQLIRMAPFFAVGALYLGVRTCIGIQMSFDTQYGDTILSRILIVVWTAATYLRISLFPIYLSIQYWAPKPSVLFGPWSGVALSSIIVVVYFGWRLRKVSYLYPLGLAWFVVGLSPFLNIIPSRMIASERFLYMPLIGFAVFLVQGVFDIQGSLRGAPSPLPSPTRGEGDSIPSPLMGEGEGEGDSIPSPLMGEGEGGGDHGIASSPLNKSTAPRNDIVILFLVVVLCLYSARTIIRNNDWVEPIQFWTKELKNNPGRALAPYNLGVLYDKDGKRDKTVEYYLSAMKEYSGYSMLARNNLALIFEDRKEPEKAKVLYIDNIRLYPDKVAAYVNLSLIYIEEKNYQTAKNMLDAALKIDPNSYHLHRALEQFYISTGDAEKALEHGKKADGLNPNFGRSIP